MTFYLFIFYAFSRAIQHTSAFHSLRRIRARTTQGFGMHVHRMYTDLQGWCDGRASNDEGHSLRREIARKRGATMGPSNASVLLWFDDGSRMRQRRILLHATGIHK